MSSRDGRGSRRKHDHTQKNGDRKYSKSGKEPTNPETNSFAYQGRSIESQEAGSYIKRPTSTGPAEPRPPPGPRPKPIPKQVTTKISWDSSEFVTITIRKRKVQAMKGSSKHTFITKEFAKDLGLRLSKTSQGPCYPGSKHSSTEKIKTSIVLIGETTDDINLYIAKGDLPRPVVLGTNIMSQLEPPAPNMQSSDNSRTSTYLQSTSQVQLPIRSAYESSETDSNSYPLKPSSTITPLSKTSYAPMNYQESSSSNELLQPKEHDCDSTEGQIYSQVMSSSPLGYPRSEQTFNSTYQGGIAPSYNYSYTSCPIQSTSGNYDYLPLSPQYTTESLADGATETKIQPPRPHTGTYAYQPTGPSNRQPYYYRETAPGEPQREQDSQY